MTSKKKTSLDVLLELKKEIKEVKKIIEDNNRRIENIEMKALTNEELLHQINFLFTDIGFKLDEELSLKKSIGGSTKSETSGTKNSGRIQDIRMWIRTNFTKYEDKFYKSKIVEQKEIDEIKELAEKEFSKKKKKGDYNKFLHNKIYDFLKTNKRIKETKNLRKEIETPIIQEDEFEIEEENEL